MSKFLGGVYPRSPKDAQLQKKWIKNYWVPVWFLHICEVVQNSLHLGLQTVLFICPPVLRVKKGFPLPLPSDLAVGLFYLTILVVLFLVNGLKNPP